MTVITKAVSKLDRTDAKPELPKPTTPVTTPTISKVGNRQLPIFQKNADQDRDEDPTFFPWIRIRLSWEKNPNPTLNIFIF